ncbi:MAG: SET domain-containing protein-lysine N-methyltransferase [Candidatus Pacearchaeota archaeon]
MQQQILEYIEIKKSGIHSNGAFARCFIPKGTRIIEYIGRKIKKNEADEIADKELENHKKDSSKGAVYIFELNDEYDIDGNVPWNMAKYINHSCSPNAEVEIENDRIWIIAMRDINSGEEITYDYGYDLDEWEDHPCNCGSKNCIGYIISRDEWDKFKEIKKENSKN